MEKSLLEKVLERRAAGETARVSLGAMNFGKRTSEAESKNLVAAITFVGHAGRCLARLRGSYRRSRLPCAGHDR